MKWNGIDKFMLLAERKGTEEKIGGTWKNKSKRRSWTTFFAKSKNLIGLDLDGCSLFDWIRFV